MMLKSVLVVSAILCVCALGALGDDMVVKQLNHKAVEGARRPTREDIAKGLIHGKKERRIVGGTETTPNEFPFMVSTSCECGISCNNYRSHYCGASLISNEPGSVWALSAAHCACPEVATEFGLSNTKIVAGLHDLRIAGSGTPVTVERVVCHPDYDPDTMDNDIVLYKLANPVNDPDADIINLGAAPPAGSDVQVAGWGATASGAAASPVLLKTTVEVSSQASCRAQYSPFGIPITDNMVCAAGPNRDSCQGDSGGPLFDGNTQIGVVSFGIGCADPDFDGVYARVSEYRDWIDGFVSGAVQPPQTFGSDPAATAAGTIQRSQEVAALRAVISSPGKVAFVMDGSCNADLDIAVSVGSPSNDPVAGAFTGSTREQVVLDITEASPGNPLVLYATVSSFAGSNADFEIAVVGEEGLQIQASSLLGPGGDDDDDDDNDDDDVSSATLAASDDLSVPETSASASLAPTDPIFGDDDDDDDDDSSSGDDDDDDSSSGDDDDDDILLPVEETPNLENEEQALVDSLDSAAAGVAPVATIAVALVLALAVL